MMMWNNIPLCGKMCLMYNGGDFMKRMLTLFAAVALLLTACGSDSSNKIDSEALESISKGLEKRWEYTEQLPDEVTMEELERAVQIELDGLQEYDDDAFDDFSLFALYDRYRRELDSIKRTMSIESIDSPRFEERWSDHREQRAKILYDLNDSYHLDISDENKEILKEVLADSKNLVEAERVEKELSKIKGISDFEVKVEDKSIAITYPTESVLSVKSFISQKTGFPGKAIEILENIKDKGYERVVISTINQETIAVSTYFTNKSLNSLDFDEWEECDSYDAYKFYKMADAYHIRLGIWNDLDSEIQQLIGNMNKDNSNEFWKRHGFTHQ